MFPLGDSKPSSNNFLIFHNHHSGSFRLSHCAGCAIMPVIFAALTRLPAHYYDISATSDSDINATSLSLPAPPGHGGLTSGTPGITRPANRSRRRAVHYPVSIMKLSASHAARECLTSCLPNGLLTPMDT